MDLATFGVFLRLFANVVDVRSSRGKDVFSSANNVGVLIAASPRRGRLQRLAEGEELRGLHAWVIRHIYVIYRDNVRVRVVDDAQVKWRLLSSSSSFLLLLLLVEKTLRENFWGLEFLFKTVLFVCTTETHLHNNYRLTLVCISYSFFFDSLLHSFPPPLLLSLSVLDF